MNSMKDDAISRQAAIDVLEKGLPSEPLKSKYTEGITVGFGLAITWIEQLPAVQPQQIVRCKDCNKASKCYGDVVMRSRGGGNIYCPLEFCSAAERRTDG